jgi:hypothetical protein
MMYPPLFRAAFYLRIFMQRLLPAFAAIFFTYGLLTAAPAFAAKDGEVCGGIAAIACDKGLFCEKPAGQCNTPDLSGTCEKIAEVCIEKEAPVCGCPTDKHKYGEGFGNDCKRKAAGAQKDHDGKCGSEK